MPHDEDCDTCRRLADSEVVVRLEPTDDPCAMRFVAHPWPVEEPRRYTTASEADVDPLARSLWRNGTTSVALDADGAVVTRTDPRAWPFYGDAMLTTLREALTLLR